MDKKLDLVTNQRRGQSKKAVECAKMKSELRTRSFAMSSLSEVPSELGVEALN